jgi:L-cysteine S-thiosulfotransferase
MMVRLLLLLLVCSALLGATDHRTSGNSYLSPQLLALQNDTQRNPAVLWQERGLVMWQSQCVQCHGEISQLKRSAATFPRLSGDGKTLHNLEDQISNCLQKPKAIAAKIIDSTQAGQTSPESNATENSNAESDAVLSLSAALHLAAIGQTIEVSDEKLSSSAAAQWQTRLTSGRSLYETRIGKMNLACIHCHDQKVGAQMRADIISQGHPTGFPIYRMSWQTMGSVERRLRACYSGVQAPLPAAGSAELRDLELFMKVRANGMALDGPSIRR